MGLVSGDFHLEKPIDDKARESKTSNKDEERTIPFHLAPREFRGKIGLMRRTCLIDYTNNPSGNKSYVDDYTLPSHSPNLMNRNAG